MPPTTAALTGWTTDAHGNLVSDGTGGDPSQAFGQRILLRCDPATAGETRIELRDLTHDYPYAGLSFSFDWGDDPNATEPQRGGIALVVRGDGGVNVPAFAAGPSGTTIRGTATPDGFVGIQANSVVEIIATGGDGWRFEHDGTLRPPLPNVLPAEPTLQDIAGLLVTLGLARQGA
jgi:hypothetical protein